MIKGRYKKKEVPGRKKRVCDGDRAKNVKLGKGENKKKISEEKSTKNKKVS